MITVASFIILIGILVFVHELGHFILAKRIGVKIIKFSLGLGPRLIGKKIGETEYLISAFPLGGYVKMAGEDPTEEVPPEDLERSFMAQPVLKRTAIVSAGPIFNFLFAYLVFLIILAQGLPINIPSIGTFLPRLGQVDIDSPASRSGLKEGDIVIAINAQRIFTWDEMTEIVMKNPEKELTLRVKRDREEIGLKVIPKKVVVKDLKGADIEIGRIGVSKRLETKIVKGDILNAPLKAAIALYGWSELVIQSIIRLITGKLSFKYIGGPILIGKMSGEVASIGISAFIMFMSIISINLAILNLLPIPILDGGHLLLFAIESIRRRPLSIKMRERAQQIGLFIIIILMIFAFYNDIMRFLSSKAL